MIARWHVIALAALSATAIACRKTTTPPVVGEAALADSAEQVLWDIHQFLTENGVKKGDLYADTAFVFNDQTKFVLRVVRGEFTTETGKPYGTMKGDRGTYDLRSKTLVGYGNVVITSNEGRTLTTNHIKYVEATNLVSSDSFWTMRQGKDVSTGIRFRSDPNLNRFRCDSACRGSMIVPMKALDKP